MGINVNEEIQVTGVKSSLFGGFSLVTCYQQNVIGYQNKHFFFLYA